MITTLPVYSNDKITGYVSICKSCGKWWNTSSKTGRTGTHKC